MRICIDATPIAIAKADKGGVYRYISQLIDHLPVIDDCNEYTLFFNIFRSSLREKLYKEVVQHLPEKNNFQIKVSRIPARIWQRINMPVEICAGNFNIFHGCFDSLPPMLGRKGVVTIHDVRYLDDLDEEINQEWLETLREKASPSDFYVKDYLARFELFNTLKKQMLLTLKRASTIITVSGFSKRKIVQKLGIPQAMVNVVYQGTEDALCGPSTDRSIDLKRRYGICKPYILHVGKFDPLKNIEGILSVFRTLVESNNDYLLVLAGPVSWYYFIIQEEIKRLNLQDRVICTGYVCDHELRALYKEASLFFMPSLYEGFGIPLIEAMACGCPVAASNVTSVPEIAGDAAVLVDPFDQDGMVSTIEMILRNKEMRYEMVRRGLSRAKEFSWIKTAKETLRVYERACNEQNK